MKDLASWLSEQGFEDIKTYIQSGNVVLKGQSSPGDSVKFEIERRFGFKPEIMVLNKQEFEVAVENNPFNAKEGKELHFFFTSELPKPEMGKITSLVSSSEKFEIKGKVFYLHAPEGIGRSKLVANLEKCIGVPATGRNFNTVMKIMEMAKNG